MILRRGPSDQLAARGVGCYPRVGHQRLQSGEQCSGAYPLNRIDFVSRLIFRLDVRRDLFQQGLDLFVFRGSGSDQQSLGLGVQQRLDLGEHRLQHLLRGGRIDRTDRVGNQLGSVQIGFRRLQLIHRVLDCLLIARDGQGHQAARLRVNRQLRVRYQALQQRERGGRVDLGKPVYGYHRRCIRGAAALEFLQSCFERLVILGRTPGDQFSVG